MLKILLKFSDVPLNGVIGSYTPSITVCFGPIGLNDRLCAAAARS